MTDAGAHWRLINQRTLVQDPWLTVYENDYELPDGSRLGGFHALEERDGVMIMALTEGREVLLVRQYRPGVDGFVYELPAGFLEAGETDILERAKTELREETGYVTDTWRSIGTIHDAPSRMKKTSHCFLALNARKATEQDDDPTEFVSYESIPLTTVQRMITDGKITSAVTIATVFKGIFALEALPEQRRRVIGT